MATRKVNALDSGAGEPQTIEQLQQRYDQLNTQKIQCKTKLDSALEQLEKLKRDAREKYGTDDLTALQARLDQLKAENEQKRASYQAHLDRIESDLSQVEQNFQDAEALAAKD